MGNEFVILGSSNYTKEYLLDVIEAIGRPRGHIMHFRYGKEWVDSELWAQIPPKNGTKNSPLLGSAVLITYIFQTTDKVSQNIKWDSVYPIRFGKLIDLYKTGDGLYDIAYFYFELLDYCFVEKNPVDDEKLLSSINKEIISTLNTHSDRGSDHCFAAIKQLETVKITEATDDSAFHNTAGRLRFEHFESPDRSIQYYPVFVQVHDVRSPRKEFVWSLEKQYCEFTEGFNYDLSINTFLRKTPPTKISLEIKCPERQFIFPTAITEYLESRYDEFSWRIVPAKVQKDTFTTMIVSVKADPVDFLLPSGQKGEILNPVLEIPVQLKFNRGFRRIETFQDSSLAVATFIIALIGLSQKMPQDNKLLNVSLFFAAAFFLVATVLKFISQWKAK